MQAVNR